MRERTMNAVPRQRAEKPDMSRPDASDCHASKLRAKMGCSAGLPRRRFLLVGLVLAGLAGCTGAEPVVFGPDGKQLPRIYRIDPAQTGQVQLRLLDAVNTLRRAAGLTQLGLEARLNAAAATHSRDMAVQNRPWHFGSDGSSPIDRVARVGYAGTLRGELISETFESELETLAGWMARADTRAIVLDPEAVELGIAFFQEPNGKLWWTMVTAAPDNSSNAAPEPSIMPEPLGTGLLTSGAS